MKKQIIRSILAMLLILSMTAGYSLAVLAEEDSDKPLDMAYNIYSNPQFGDMERKFETFTIDMRATMTPYCTYWSLANFNMHISDLTRKEYPDIRSGGAYAGLQNTDEVGGRKAIMAFWEWHYWPDGYKPGVEETNLVAERIYPHGSSQFGGEGEGTNYIRNYPWHDNEWYRMVLHTWTDPIRKTTYCGQWVADLSTGKWTLISYFDTKMRESYLEGDMSFFMENFVGTTAGEERDVQLKNLYIKHYDTKEWMSIDSTRLRHCNDWANNKTGKHSFGATEEYFWAKSGGFLTENDPDQETHDAEWPAQVFTINQPDQPTFGTVGIEEIRLAKKEDEWYARWIMKTDSTPQLWYRMDIKDENGKTLYTNQATKPEAFYEMLDHIKTDVFTCTVTVKDIFGNTTSFTQGTEKYEELYGQKSETPIVDNDDNGGNLGLIIGISAGAVALLAIAGVAIMVAMKAKKKKN